MTDQESINEAEIETTVETTAQEQPIASDEATSNFIDLITDDELKGNKSLSNFKDINGLAKSFIHLEKKLGQPKEEAVEYKPEDYSFTAPEDYQINDDVLAAVRDKAIEGKVNPEAFKGMVETFTSIDKEQAANIERQNQEDKERELGELISSLKEEWGPEYEDRLERADKTWQTLNSEGADKPLSKFDSNTRLEIARIMDNISSKISEPKVGSQEGNSSLTKEEIQNSIEKITSSDAYNNGDKEAVDTVFNLYSKLNSVG